MSTERPPAVPAVVIGGYLGAGKTTLINQLLRAEAAQPDGRRIAVLVNDFGEISIDADLIEGADGEVLSLAGGCVCCSFGADLVGTLHTVLAREPPPDVVLVETSGVGLPAAVARTAALVPGLAMRGCVVVADVSQLPAQAADRYVGDTVRQQLHEADLLLLSKIDGLTCDECAAFDGWLRQQAIAAPCVQASHGQVASDVVLGVRSLEFDRSVEKVDKVDDVEEAPAVPALRKSARPLAPAAERFVAHTRRFAGAVDVLALGHELQAAGALRAKGVLLDATSGLWHELQLAGRRLELMPLTPARTPAEGRLVAIHLRAASDECRTP